MMSSQSNQPDSSARSQYLGGKARTEAQALKPLIDLESRNERRMAEKLTRSASARITKDWLAELPGLGEYKLRHLLRRVGPLLVGVSLDRDSSGDKYIPCSHVHFLGNTKLPVVSLTLCQQLRTTAGRPDVVLVRRHEEHFRDAAARLEAQSPLPFSGPLCLDEVLKAYRDHLETPIGSRQAAMLFSDLIMLQAGCGRSEDALRSLEEVTSFAWRVDFDHDHGNLSRGHVHPLHVKPGDASKVNTSPARKPEPGEYLDPVLSDPKTRNRSGGGK